MPFPVCPFPVEGVFKMSNKEKPPGSQYVEISYPEYKPRAQDFVIVSLSHVRAADDIRIHYDFDRDGWVISQAQVFEWVVESVEYPA